MLACCCANLPQYWHNPMLLIGCRRFSSAEVREASNDPTPTAIRVRRLSFIATTSSRNESRTPHSSSAALAVSVPVDSACETIHKASNLKVAQRALGIFKGIKLTL